MENKSDRSVGKRFWRIVRIVCYMLRKGLSKRKLITEFQVLRKRSKIAGKAISGLVCNSRDPFRHHNYYTAAGGSSGSAAFSCRSVEPEISYFSPQAVEFSCSNTPSYPLFPIKRKLRERKAIEIVDFVHDMAVETVNAAENGELEEMGEVESHVDRDAEEFIRRFYEQLKLQTMTPVMESCRRRQAVYG